MSNFSGKTFTYDKSILSCNKFVIIIVTFKFNNNFWISFYN